MKSSPRPVRFVPATLHWLDGSRPDESVIFPVPVRQRAGATTRVEAAGRGRPFAYYSARERGDVHPLNLCRSLLPEILQGFEEGWINTSTWSEFFAEPVDVF